MIDCDLHNEVPNIRALFPYFAPHWIEHIENTLFKGPSDTACYVVFEQNCIRRRLLRI